MQSSPHGINIEEIKSDLKEEKANVKNILNEEFGWYGKSPDSIANRTYSPAENQKKDDFKIEWDDE